MSEIEHIVYSITCTNTGIRYFGRSQEIEKRWRAHKNMLRRGIHNNLLLQTDWTIHGENSFVFEKLHTYNNKEEAETKEQEYIDNKNIVKYNISDAKDGGDTFTNNPKQEDIRNLKRINSSGKNNPMYGKEKNDYTIQRIKEANSKPIVIQNVTYPSLSEASRKLGVGATTINYRLNSENFPEWSYI